MNSACQLCVEYKESNNNEIISSAEKVVRPWPDRRLRPCYTRTAVARHPCFSWVFLLTKELLTFIYTCHFLVFCLQVYLGERYCIMFTFVLMWANSILSQKYLANGISSCSPLTTPMMFNFIWISHFANNKFWRNYWRHHLQRICNNQYILKQTFNSIKKTL